MQGISFDNTPIHIPVLKNEVISYLDIQPDGIYVDETELDSESIEKEAYKRFEDLLI